MRKLRCTYFTCSVQLLSCPVIKDAGPGFAQALQFLLIPPKPATRVGGIILLNKTKGVEGGKNRGLSRGA